MRINETGGVKTVGRRKRLKNLMSRLSIRYKLFLIYCLVIIIPLAVAGFYLNVAIQEILISQAEQEANINMNRIETRINFVMDRIAYISQEVSEDPNLVFWGYHTFENSLEIFDANREPSYSLFVDRERGVDFITHYDEVVDIRFYTFNETAINTSNVLRVTDEVRHSTWFNEAITNQGRPAWMLIRDEITRRDQFILTRLIFNEEINQPLGVLNIYVSHQSLRNIFQHEENDPLSLNHEAFILFDSELLLSDEADDFFEVVEQINRVKNDDLIVDSDTKVILRDISMWAAPNNNLQIISIIPIEQVTANVNAVMRGVFLVVGACLLFSASLILTFITKFHKNVKYVKKAMEQVSSGDYDIAPSIKSHDEIGEIYEQLYDTMHTLQNLMEENMNQRLQTEQWKLRQKESEFQHLTSQINPHFIYNTLEMIRVGVLKHGGNDVAQIVTLLGKLLRRSLETNEKFIPLAQEIEFIDMYLQLQQLRFKDKLIYNIDVNVNQSLMIMPLLIQPIVENAFVHGVELKSGQSEITISVYEANDHLVVEVEDNGVGIDPERLAELQEMLEISYDNEPESIGLKNIMQRIKLYYGDEYGLLLESDFGLWTKITLKIPNDKGDTDA